MATLQFVDSIASSPTLRLDINDGTNFNLFRDPDFSPPPLKRVRTATLMTDGDYIAATAYANRVIRLRLRVHGTSKDNLATNLQSLDRELDRKNNILKWQSTNATNPVFFRTFRSDYKLEVGLNESGDALNDVVVTLAIEAEPFAYGLRVTGSPVTVNNDPAAGSNGLYLTVTGVTGDVPTPVYLEITHTTISSTVVSALAVRRHGTPTLSWIQAESCTQGTDTTTQVNDATMSGAGNNYSRTTFATATMADRLTWASFPAASGVDIRGNYRIFARLRKGTAGDGINIEMAYGGYTSTKVATPSTVNRHWLDLGIITVPPGYQDPIVDGYSNTAQPIATAPLVFRAERTSGAGALDWDAFVAMPADEEWTAIEHSLPVSSEFVIDGPLDTAYSRATATGNLEISSPVRRIGQIPLLTPNQTNLLVWLVNTSSSLLDAIGTTSSLTVSYWPRFLFIRP